MKLEQNDFIEYVSDICKSTVVTCFNISLNNNNVIQIPTYSSIQKFLNILTGKTLNRTRPGADSLLGVPFIALSKKFVKKHAIIAEKN